MIHGLEKNDYIERAPIEPDAVATIEPVAPALPSVTREDVLAIGPRHGTLWASLLYAVSVLSLGYPAFAGKFLAGPNSDQFVAGYAFREFGAAMLKATGGFAQWNPYLFGGMPYIAAMHGDIFYPTFILRMLMPTDAAMTWSFILHLFLAGLFTYKFVRSSGFGFYPALFAGVAYMMSGQLASLVSPGHDGKLSVSALFPLGLWMITLGMRKGKAWSWGVFALTIGLAVLSPHPQLLQYLLLATGAFTLHLAVSEFRKREAPVGTIFGRMGLALMSVVIGGAIGAIQYLPVREYVTWSPRAGGLADYATAVTYAWPTKELFDVYLPQFTGMIDAYWGENAIHLHSDYAGVVLLILAAAGLFGLRKDPRKGFLIFWSVTLVIALLWALGGHTPFYKIPYAIIPGTKYFRAPATVFFVGTMALSVLAAAGVERVLIRQIGAKYATAWIVIGALIAGLGVAGILTDFARALAPDEMLDMVISNARAVVYGAWRSFAFVLLAGIVIIVYRRTRMRPAIAGWTLAILAVIDSVTIMHNYWVFSPGASITYRSDAAIEKVKADRQPSRVLAIELEPNERRDTNLQGDGLMSHRVRTVLGYHGNQLGRFNEILQKDEGFQQVFNPRIWQLYNVRYLLTNTNDVSQFFPGSQWVIGPVEDNAGTKVYLYQLPGENPLAWVAPVIVKAADDRVGATLLNSSFDLERAALFAEDANVAAVDSLAVLPLATGITVGVTKYEPGRISLELSSPAPAGSALLVSENYFPGWSAKVDGNPAPIGRADYTIIGVQLPSGGRKIELTFDDPAYERGKVITIIALVLTALMIGAGFYREQRAIARA